MRDGYKLSPADVKTASDLVAQDQTVDLREHFLKGSLTPGGKRRIAPKSINQRRYLDAIDGNDIVFGVGPAGTGKTYLAMAQAVAFLVAKKVTRIILARPAVEAGEKLGFLPGDLQEKVNPYLRPLYDALYDMLDVERVGRYLERGTIEIAPIAFMRGRTLNDSFVILDEAQNTTSEQMKMFLTRLGFGSKAVITGDVTQIDLPPGRTSGLVEAIKVVGAIEGISFIHFDDRDVVRHKLVQQIVKAYEAFSGGNGDYRATPRYGGVPTSRAALHERAMSPDDPGSRRSFAPRARAVAPGLRVEVVDGRGRAVRAGGLDRWLAAVVPSRIRGAVSVALVSDRRVRGLESRLPRERLRHRRSQFSRLARRLRFLEQTGGPSVPGRHRHRHGGGAASGAGGGPLRTDGGPNSRPPWPVAPDRLRSRARRRRDGAAERRLRRKGGLREGLIERARPASRADAQGPDTGTMIPLLIFLLALAGIYLGAIEAAFSALMRLSLRLVAERSGRPDSLTEYLDDPVLLFVPVRVLLGLANVATTALLAAVIGVEGAHRLGLVIVSVAVFAIVFELFIPLLIVGRDPERMLVLLLPTFNPIAKLLSPLTRWIARSVANNRRGAAAAGRGRDARRRPNEAANAFNETAEQEGLIAGEERRLLQNIVDFGDSLVREVMTPAARHRRHS